MHWTPANITTMVTAATALVVAVTHLVVNLKRGNLARPGGQAPQEGGK